MLVAHAEVVARVGQFFRGLGLLLLAAGVVFGAASVEERMAIASADPVKVEVRKVLDRTPSGEVTDVLVQAQDGRSWVVDVHYSPVPAPGAEFEVVPDPEDTRKAWLPSQLRFPDVTRVFVLRVLPGALVLAVGILLAVAQSAMTTARSSGTSGVASGPPVTDRDTRPPRRLFGPANWLWMFPALFAGFALLFVADHLDIPYVVIWGGPVLALPLAVTWWFKTRNR